MAFLIVKHDMNTQFPTEYRLLKDNEGSTYGEALTVDTSTGRLTKCAATSIPEYIALVTQTAEATSVTPIPIVRVQDEQTYEVKSTATVATTLKGNKVTIDSTGLLITATTTSGVFFVDDTDGATTTSTVRGHFRR